jgi:hypothetical protein
VEDHRHVAALKPCEAHAATVERDDRRSIDREPDPSAVELAEYEARRLHPGDETAVDGPARGCSRRRKHQRSAKHQHQPSHASMLAKAGQGRVCDL